MSPMPEVPVSYFSLCAVLQQAHSRRTPWVSGTIIFLLSGMVPSTASILIKLSEWGQWMSEWMNECINEWEGRERYKDVQALRSVGVLVGNYLWATVCFSLTCLPISRVSETLFSEWLSGPPADHFAFIKVNGEVLD